MIKKTLLITALMAATLLFLLSCGNNNNYEGETKDNLPHGTGTLTYPNGTVYRGDFEAGLRSGEGTWISAEGTTYRGQWQNDLYHGYGTLIIPGTLSYKGYWEEGKREGQGIQTWSDGRQYEGTWRADRRDGEGIMFYPDGTYYAGQWLKGNKHGEGTLYQAGRIIKEGDWAKGEFHYTPVETIALGADQLVLQQGISSYNLEAIVLPHDASDPTLAWETSDPDIVTVEEGEIIPHEPGEAVITVTAVAEEIFATCDITIIPGLVRASGISLDRNSLSLRVDQDSVYLYATVQPADAVEKEVAWSSSDPGIASVNQAGLVTPQAPGQTTITAETLDGGFYDQCLVTVRENLFDNDLFENDIDDD